MKAPTIINLGLAAASFAAAAASRPFLRRDATTGTCNIKFASSTGGRKIAIAVDSSGSMSTTDPKRLRIQAGKALTSQLVPAAGAGGGKNADVITVIDFDDSGKVIYPLGDPASAGTSFDKIDSSGGTNIADGVTKAVAELTKPGNDPTADRSGIVVLTDGEDSSVAKLVAAIENAGKLGIRVSFGFLGTPSTALQPALQAILKTGGTYASFKTADSIDAFLFLILSNGLTASDVSATTEQPLLSGITVAKLSGSKPVAFTYAAQSGEVLTFTVESLSKQALDAELQDASGASLAKNSTTKTAASIKYTASGAGDLKLIVSSTNSTAEGVFQVSLNSSLGISGCNLTTTPPPTNTSGPSGTVTGGPSGPTKTSPPVTTVTAAAAKVAFPAFGLLLAALLL